MHDLGPNSLEHNPMLNEIFGGPQSEAYESESPLHETWGHETGTHELHEYREAPLHEVFHESDEFSGFGEVAGEYHESGQHESDETAFHNEIALAAELMNVQNDAELQQFIGKLIRTGRNLLRSPAGRVLVSGLRKVARKTLPMVAKVAGSALGGPAGGIIGGALGNLAVNAMGLEVQGMTQEEANFASARQFVRFARQAARIADQAVTRPGANPATIARSAVMLAAQQYAPGLLGPQGGTIPAPRLTGVRANRGVWVRRGNSIVIFGV